MSEQPTTVGGPRTLARRRHEMILGELRRNGTVRVVELSKRLHVSDMTVRRDLETLAEAGLLTKVHGGATARFRRSTEEPGFETKSLRNQPEKDAIARAASLLVSAGNAIGITAGSTTARLAVALVNIPDLTIVTNSVRVGDVFAATPRPDRTMIQLGGVRTPSDALVGPLADAALSGLHLDLVFMGVHGMDAYAGFTTPNLVEASTNKAFVRSANELVVLADHTKWGITGLTTICALEAAHTLVTSDQLPEVARPILTEAVGRLIEASPEPEPLHRSL